MSLSINYLNDVWTFGNVNIAIMILQQGVHGIVIADLNCQLVHYICLPSLSD